MIRRTAGAVESIEADHAIIPSGELDLTKRVRLVMHLSDAQPTRGVGKEQVSFREEELERAGLRRVSLTRNTIDKLRIVIIASAMRSVPYPAIVRCIRVHLGMLIGQVEEGAGRPDCQRLVAIQAVEPNPGSPLFIENVGAEIQLQEVTEPRNGWAESGAHVSHEEWNDPQPGVPVEGIHLQSRWQRRLNLGGVPSPVKEGEFVPALKHDRRLRRPMPVAESGIEGWIHAGPYACPNRKDRLLDAKTRQGGLPSTIRVGWRMSRRDRLRSPRWMFSFSWILNLPIAKASR